MGRKPYDPQYSKFPYSIGHNSLMKRSEFAQLVGECISMWSHFEHEVGTVFGLLIGVQSVAALEIFVSLRRSSNQRETLLIAAKRKLAGEMIKAFQAFLLIYKSVESERNALAHGCFGELQTNTEAVAWIQQDHYVNFQAEAILRQSKGDYSDAHRGLRENLFVYTLDDLIKVRGEISSLWFMAFHWHVMLRYEQTNPTLSGEHFEQLCAMPRMVEQMALSKDQSKTPE